MRRLSLRGPALALLASRVLVARCDDMMGGGADGSTLGPAGGVRSGAGAPRVAGAHGASGGSSLRAGPRVVGHAASGAAESAGGTPWSHTPAAAQVTLLKSMRCRRTAHVEKLLPTVPKVQHVRRAACA